MKWTEITFRTVWDAIRHQMRAFVAALCLFMLLGLGLGWVYSDRTAAPAEGGAEPLMLSPLSDIPESVTTYSEWNKLLTTGVQNASLYLDTLSNAGLTSEQTKAVNALRLRLTELQNEALSPIKDSLSDPFGIYVPEAFLDEYAASVEQQLKTYRLNVVTYSAAVELLKSMDAPTLENEAVAKSYTSLLNQAVAYGSALQTIAKLEQIQKKLEDRDAVLADGAVLEAALLKAEKELDALVDEINQTTDTIASEAHLLIRLTYDANGTATVTLTHAHDEVLPQDNFAATVLFCTAVGAALGLFLAVWRESTANRKPESTDEAEGTSDVMK